MVTLDGGKIRPSEFYTLHDVHFVNWRHFINVWQCAVVVETTAETLDHTPTLMRLPKKLGAMQGGCDRRGIPPAPSDLVPFEGLLRNFHCLMVNPNETPSFCDKESITWFVGRKVPMT